VAAVRGEDNGRYLGERDLVLRGAEMVHSVQKADPGLSCWSALSKPNGHTGGERGVLAANWPGANSKGHQAAAGWRREVVVHGERGQTRRSGRCSGRENKFTVDDAVVRAC
jgi:hypothetical protein